MQERGVEQPRRHGVDPDALSGAVSGQGQRHPDDSALAGAVGTLPDLTVERRDGRCVDDHASLTVFRGFVLSDHAYCESRNIERADGVDLYDLFKNKIKRYYSLWKKYANQCPVEILFFIYSERTYPGKIL